MHLAVLAGLLIAPNSSAVSFSETKADGVAVRVIQANLADPSVRVSVEVSNTFPQGDESFASFVKRAQPIAAVNGAYFDKYTFKPIGDIVSDGRLRSQGLMGTVLAITPNNEVVIRRVQRHRRQDWSRYETVLGCGPALLLDGQIDVQAESEGFGSYVIAPAQRMAVGVTKSNKLLIVHIRAAVSFERAASIMQELGCVQAMNLDGGASLAMYHNGKTHHSPSRKLTNVLMIHLDPYRRFSR